MEIFTLLPGGQVRLRAQGQLVEFVCEQADVVEHVLHTPSDPSFYRLCGPVNVEVSEDDVFTRLEREMTIEALCARVRTSAKAETLSREDLEAWLSVLSMALGVLAAKLGIVDDESRDDAPMGAEAYFTASNVISCCVVEALEALDEA